MRLTILIGLMGVAVAGTLLVSGLALDHLLAHAINQIQTGLQQ